jgi:DeoR/GlpR family transcriptional regulator of sugar metabolism
MIATLKVRKTIFSVAGITEEGFYNDNLLLVETERAMMRAADEVIVVADSSKFGRRSLTHLCGLSEISYLVVDDGISDTWRGRLQAAGVRPLIADTPVVAGTPVVSGVPLVAANRTAGKDEL